MIKSSIDIGTNSVLLLVAEVTANGINVLYEEQRIPRLGRGVDRDKNLQADSQTRVVNVLKEYLEILKSEYPNVNQKPIVTATSAVRDSSNRAEFLDKVRQETGLEVLLLSGRKEAETTFAGALSVLEDSSDQYSVVLDIGGGSTEIAGGRGYELKSAESLDIGSVRFTERYFKHDPPDENEINSARHAIINELKTASLPDDDYRAIGVAGTVLSIAAITMGLNEYNAGKLNGHVLRKEEIQSFINEIISLTSYSIEEKHPEFLKRRGEVILAGAIILDEFLSYAGKEEIMISTGGIRYGIILNEP